jgi:hypothetical protein
VETWGGQIFLTVVLVVLMSIAIGLLVYGMAGGDGGLAILGLSIATPTLFSVTVNLVMLFAWPGKR